MTAIARFLGVFAVFALLAGLALMALQLRNGVSYETAQLSGQAILAAEQRSRFEDVLSVYPLLPLLISLPFTFLPDIGLPPASLAALLLAGLVGAGMHRALVAQGMASWTALGIAALLMLNPVSLYALGVGPGAVMLMIGVLLMGRGLFGIADKGTVSDIMTTALALVLMASAHPFGLILALASPPGLVLTSPRSLFARSPGGVLLVLLFPFLFGLFSFAYTRWALGAEPFAFFNAATGVSRPLESGAAVGLQAFLPGFLASLALTAPLPLALLIWKRRDAAMLRPAIALMVTVALAGALLVAFRGRADMPLLLAVGLAAAAACTREIACERPFAVLALLFTGWIWGGALVGSHLLSPKASRQLASRHPELAPAEAMAPAVCGRRGVMADTHAHPRLAQICGTAAGFITTGDPDFEIQLQSRRITGPYVLVPESRFASEFDVIAHNFPDLYRHGAPGYALIHDQAGWRLYARIEQKQPISEIRTSDADLLRR
jgi:hypothetical protein